MDDDDRSPSMASAFGGHAATGRPADAAALLAGENLDPYSQDELVLRIEQLEAEIARVRAHMASASAHRLAAEALFRPKGT